MALGVSIQFRNVGFWGKLEKLVKKNDESRMRGNKIKIIDEPHHSHFGEG